MKKLMFLLVLFASGCATTADFGMLKADINQLKRESFDIKKDASDTKTALADVKEKSAKEDALNAMRESEALLRSDVTGISKDLQTLIGRFDESKYFIDKTLKDTASEMELLRSQINTLEAQIKELQGRLSSKTDTDTKTKGKMEIKKDKKESEDAKLPETKEPEINDPAKMYEAAYATFKDKKYKEAREKFEAFIKKFPKDNLADNAQFWIAETYYAEEDYAGAIVEYDALLENYPNSGKIPTALLKQGNAFIEFGDKKAARGIFEYLMTKYPKSKEAGIAKKKLEDIDIKGKHKKM